MQSVLQSDQTAVEQNPDNQQTRRSGNKQHTQPKEPSPQSTVPSSEAHGAPGPQRGVGRRKGSSRGGEREKPQKPIQQTCTDTSGREKPVGVLGFRTRPLGESRGGETASRKGARDARREKDARSRPRRDTMSAVSTASWDTESARTSVITPRGTAER